MKSICPACEKPIGNLHRTPNGFHRDCFTHWTKGYECAMRFTNSELKIAGLPDIITFYRERCSIKKQPIPKLFIHSKDNMSQDYISTDVEEVITWQKEDHKKEENYQVRRKQK